VMSSRLAEMAKRKGLDKAAVRKLEKMLQS
jgi:hypothetical protein